MAELLLGVDGGNTKCVALVARPDGTVVGAARAGCADIYGGHGEEAALAELGAAATAALEAAGAGPADVAAAAFSLAGADWPEDRRFLHDEIVRRLSGLGRLEVFNDALGALRAGTSDGVGVAVVCGTGGCVGARGREGPPWHSSWWAVDTGGWAIGRRALEAVYASELGTGPETTLTDRALEVFAASSVEEILHAFTRRGGRPPFEAALLAPAALREAVAGDECARGIVVGQGAVLGSVAAAAARIVGLAGAPFPLVLLGGVLRGDGAVLLRAEITSRVPEGVPVASRFEPAAGALLAAFDALGIEADEGRLHETFPSAELFASASGPVPAAAARNGVHG
jgi:N-acetylglucosamine kinase-like BadF-type ATPase